MAAKKRFLLRIGADVHQALEQWAADDLRSVNAQIEYLLTEAVRKAGRLRRPPRVVDRSGQDASGPPRG